MLDINGMTFKKDFLPKFLFIKDLQYFEGTLLAEYQTKKGETYVFHWCDCSDTLNRWLVARISKRSLLQFESGLSTLHDLLYRDNLDETYYILDIDTNQETQKCFLVQKESLDIEYLPEEDTFILPELIFDENENSYPILIDKNWNTEDLASFPRKFIDICLLLKTSINGMRISNDGKWDGGLSSQAFYNSLRQKNKDLKIKAIQYASPGYIQFSIEREIGLLVKENIDNYIENKDKITSTFKILENYISHYELNKKESKDFINTHKDFFMEKGAELMEYFSEPNWSWIVEVSEDEFKAIKTAMSFYRRIVFLSKRVLDKKAMFGRL